MKKKKTNISKETQNIHDVRSTATATEGDASSHPHLVDYTEIGDSGEDWQAFCRDFLSVQGMAIESPPDRGADGGKDILVVEHLVGTYGRYPFRWLVSCKHYATFGKAVSPEHEQNILDRLHAYNSDGFLGFYSTVPTSGLNSRLRLLRDKRDIRDYKIFDGRLIENYLIRVGYSTLLMRYFPESYKRIKPLHIITKKYKPLNCVVCGNDILQQLQYKPYAALVAFVSKYSDGKNRILDIYWACKGNCDIDIDNRWKEQGIITQWEDISDLFIPTWYLQWCLSIMNGLHAGTDIYEGESFAKMKYFISALGQRVIIFDYQNG